MASPLPGGGLEGGREGAISRFTIADSITEQLTNLLYSVFIIETKLFSFT